MVLNACDDFSSFPVSHHADFTICGEPDEFTVAFDGFDDTTVDSMEFYDSDYTVGVDADEVGEPESGLRYSGKVAVTCTHVEAFADVVTFPSV